MSAHEATDTNVIISLCLVWILKSERVALFGLYTGVLIHVPWDSSLAQHHLPFWWPARQIQFSTYIKVVEIFIQMINCFFYLSHKQYFSSR